MCVLSKRPLIDKRRQDNDMRFSISELKIKCHFVLINDTKLQFWLYVTIVLVGGLLNNNIYLFYLVVINIEIGCNKLQYVERMDNNDVLIIKRTI